MSLLLVVALVGAWLLIGILVCVPLCLSAARGDRRQSWERTSLGGRPRRFERELESAL